MFFSLNAMNQMELTDRLALVCIPVILLLVAMLMPRKNKVFSVVVRALMIVLLAGVAVFGLVSPLADLIGTTARISFIPVVMLVEALFLLWGLLFPDAYLTQGLYGLICSVPLAAGLLGFIFPTWLSAAAFIDGSTLQSRFSRLRSTPRSCSCRSTSSCPAPIGCVSPLPGTRSSA